MSAAFIIYALPRSRTFWLSKYLTYGHWDCGHDQMAHVRGLDDVKSLLSIENHGSVETGAAPFWRLIHTMSPDLKTIVIRRPVADVAASLVATGLVVDQGLLMRQLHRLDAKLDQIECRVAGAISIRFDELNDADVCGDMFEYCTGMARDTAWYEAGKDMRLTVELHAQMKHFKAHQPQLERVARQAKQQILGRMARRPVSSAAMTFQQEPMDVAMADAKQLFAQHSVAVGEPIDSWETKNIELMRALEANGALYVTTARSNGRMFGYLMSIVAPALDSRTGVDAVQTLFMHPRTRRVSA